MVHPLYYGMHSNAHFITTCPFWKPLPNPPLSKIRYPALRVTCCGQWIVLLNMGRWGVLSNGTDNYTIADGALNACVMVFSPLTKASTPGRWPESSLYITVRLSQTDWRHPIAVTMHPSASTLKEISPFQWSYIALATVITSQSKGSLQ